MKLNAKIKWLIILSLTALAGAIRFYRLDTFPPGLHFDEAFHQVEATEILKGIYPIYFTENMGMDPMHIYLIALLFKLVGVTAIGGRLVSAIVGTLTIPATWWLTTELFADQDERVKTALATSAAFILAAMQWHITFSRTGIQPSLVPLLLVLTMACLWRGLRSGRWSWFAGAGVFLGLGLYAYSALRMAPLLIVGAAIWFFMFKRDVFRQRWPGMLICVAVSILVFAPLGIYFLTHWEQFTFRAGQVTFYTLGQGSSGPIKVLWENLVKTLAALNLKGDPELIRNLPGRPMLDPFQSILFWLGIGVCLWQARHPSYTTLLTWLGVMLLPTILTEYAPHFGRSLGAAPAVAILAGLGAVQIWHWLKHWRPAAGVTAAGLLAAGLVVSGVGHSYSYFIRWGTQSGLYQAYDAGLLAASREVYARVPETDVYLSPIQMGHPIVRFVTWDRPGAKSYDGRYCLVLPPTSDRPADFVIVPYLDSRSLERLSHFYPDGQIVGGGGGVRKGMPFYQVYRVPAKSTPSIAPQHVIHAVWNSQLELIGYDTDKASYKAGDPAVLTLYWRSLAAADVAYTAFTHLLGPLRPSTNSPVWAGADHEPGLASYPTSAWEPGEVILDEFTLYLPADTPAGTFDLEVGFYQLQTMQRLAISHADMKAGSDYVIIGQLHVQD